MTIPLRWAPGDQAVVRVTVRRLHESSAVVELPSALPGVLDPPRVGVALADLQLANLRRHLAGVRR